MADANATAEVKRLDEQCFYRSLLSCYIAKKWTGEVHNDDQLERWYDVCSRIFKAMSWVHSGDLHLEMDETILNTWYRSETTFDETSWNISTSYIFEWLTGKKAKLRNY